MRAKEFHAVKQLVFAVEVPRGTNGTATAQRGGKEFAVESKNGQIFGVEEIEAFLDLLVRVETQRNHDRVAGGDRGSLLGGSFAVVFDAGDFAHENRGNFV